MDGCSADESSTDGHGRKSDGRPVNDAPSPLKPTVLQSARELHGDGRRECGAAARVAASLRRRCSSHGCSSRGCKLAAALQLAWLQFAWLQACGGVTARMAAVRVAASLRRCKLAAALQLAWLQACDVASSRWRCSSRGYKLRRCSVATALLRWGVEPTGFFGEPGRQLESRNFCFFFTRQLQRPFLRAQEKENDNSSTRKRERAKRKPEREKKKRALKPVWSSSSQLLILLLKS